MANIITQTYFSTGELTLPLDGFKDGEIDFYITEHEPIILKKLLGYELYKEFTTALDGTPATKWTDLRDGDKEYEYNGITNEYLGIQWIIADYVFSQIVANKLSTVAMSGVKKSQKENALPANPRYKQQYALNDLSDRQITLNRFILSSNETDSSTYEDYLPIVQEKVNVFNL